MKKRPTIKEIVQHTGRSETWLRNNLCAWCDDTLLHSLQWGCSAMHEKCDPWAKDYLNMKKISS